MTDSPSWKPAATPSDLEFRARVLERIRDFFRARGVVEVETPLLTPAGVGDVHLESLAVPGHGYLRTSPETFHKRLLAAGMGDLFEVGPAFRAGERGRLHRVEFTLLEWYRVGWTWRALADEVVALIAAAGGGEFRPRWVEWRDLARESLGLDPLSATAGELDALTRDAPAGLEAPERLDWLFSTRIQPQLGNNELTVVCDFPAAQAAQARIRPGPVPIAERFEVFAGSVELANGYQELTDPAELARRFAEDRDRRARLGLAPMPPDADLLAALEAGLPECAGVALGVDRLVMWLAGDTALDRARAFGDLPGRGP